MIFIYSSVDLLDQQRLLQIFNDIQYTYRVSKKRVILLKCPLLLRKNDAKLMIFQNTPTFSISEGF